MSIAPHVLRTLVVQLVFSSLTLAFGILSIRVAPRPGRGLRCDAWHMSGVTFTTIGAIATLAAVAAFPAVAAGPGSPFYERFLTFSTIGNDARGIAVFGFALALFHVTFRRRPAPPARLEAAGLATMLVIGAGLGVLEGAFVPARQFGVMSMIGAATIFALFAALYAALVSNAMDWHLWAALAVYTVRESVNTVTQAAISLGYLSQAWRPASPLMLWAGAISLVGMIWCTLVRLGVARGGDPPGLLERLRG